VGYLTFDVTISNYETTEQKVKIFIFQNISNTDYLKN